MPSASARTEKTALLEAADPVKQLGITLEKKVRNLEKRKLKLDNYKNDVKNGKELNDDQKIAVSKYDQVIELLEYSKDLYKSLNSISQESLRVQKKLAKKEQIERQQHEIQRLKEAFYYRHILSSLETEDIRNDFLAGENGALKISEDDLHHLDQFYKLIGSDLPNDQADLEGHFHSLAENMIFLVDGKNKDIAGTTYKTLKELLKGIKDSGYFSRALEPAEEVISSDEVPEAEEIVESQISVEERTPSSILEYEPVAIVTDACEAEVTPDVEETEVVEPSNNEESELVANPEKNSFAVQNGSLQEVLASQGSFNFLQESQIELDTPHMDPAVVAVHQIPPTNMNFSVAQYQVQPVVEELHDSMANGIDHADILSLPTQIPQQMSMIANPVPRSMATVPHNGSPDFDPSHPIPTQTFTNQSYAIMQNMIVPPGTYVPVTMYDGPLAPHMAPIAVVPGLSPTVSSATSVPIHVTVATVPVPADTNPLVTGADRMSQKENVEVKMPAALNGNSSDPEIMHNDQTCERGNDTEGFVPNYHRPYRSRGRPRGQSNGYYRGRGNYNNGRGGYQGHNGYSQGGNYRRGSSYPRGRGSNNVRGGRGSSYNSNRTSQQQSQQQ